MPVVKVKLTYRICTHRSGVKVMTAVEVKLADTSSNTRHSGEVCPGSVAMDLYCCEEDLEVDIPQTILNDPHDRPWACYSILEHARKMRVHDSTYPATSLREYYDTRQSRSWVRLALDQEMMRCRTILVEWMLYQSYDLQQGDDVIYNAVHYLDAYMKCTPVDRFRLQAVGCACMFIASKLGTGGHDYQPASEWVHIFHLTNGPAEILQLELEILGVLDFDVHPVTMLSYFEVYASILRHNDVATCAALFVLEIALQQGLHQFTPSVIAASAFMLAAAETGQSFQCSDLHVPYTSVAQCSRHIAGVMHLATDTTIQKFKKQGYHKIPEWFMKPVHGKCNAITRIGTLCKKDDSFCTHHQLCGAITKKGWKCKNKNCRHHPSMKAATTRGSPFEGFK